MAENKSNLLDELKKQSDKHLSGWQRAKADYENLEKQLMKEKAEIIKNSNANMIMSLLPILDNFEMAELHKPNVSSCGDADRESFNQWIEGMQNIYNQLFNILKQAGLERIEVLGKIFDPNIMEAVEQRQVDDKREDEVVEEILPGYKFNNKILRPARVAVNKS